MRCPQQQRELLSLSAGALLRVADLPFRNGRNGREAHRVNVSSQASTVDLELAGGCGQRIGFRIGVERLIGHTGERIAFGTRDFEEATLFELCHGHETLLRLAVHAELIDVSLAHGEQWGISHSVVIGHVHCPGQRAIGALGIGHGIGS